jgi:hypothetical protein
MRIARASFESAHLTETICTALVALSTGELASLILLRMIQNKKPFSG